MPNWTQSFYRDPAYRKKVSDAVKKARAKETPAQRKEHNRKIAKSYRRTVGSGKLRMTTNYADRRDLKRWIHERDEK
jgi:hypothetical protein